MSPTVHVPGSAEDALAALRDGGVVLAGGTLLMPRLNTSAHDVEALVSLRHAGLSGVAVGDGTATIGAATPLAHLGRSPELAFLHDAVESIASPTIRNLATVGGNLFAPAPYGDLAVCLLALDAEAELDGKRLVPVDAVPEGALVTRVRFALPPAGAWRYRKAMRRRRNSAAVVTVAAVVEIREGIVTRARIALGGAAPRPVRAPGAEAALTGGPLDAARVQAAAAAAAEGADPPEDAYASAWYRRRVLPVHIRRALLGE